MHAAQTSADPQHPGSAAQGGRENTGCSADRGATEYPDLPDLSRLALGDGTGERSRVAGGVQAQAPASPSATTRLTLGQDFHITLHANTHGAPVTINVLPTFNEAGPVVGGDRVVQRIRSPRVGLPALGAGGVRLGGAPPVYTATPPPVAAPAVLASTAAAVGAAAGFAPATAATTTPAAPVPGTPAHATEAPPPPSPSLESAPDSRTPSPIPDVAGAGAPSPFPDVAGAGAPAPIANIAGAATDDVYEYIAPADPGHNRWYVVTAGRRVGIWREWTDMSNYVTGVPGNQHKLFKSRALAEAHYLNVKETDGVEVIFA